MDPQESTFTPEVIKEIFEYNMKLRDFDYTKKLTADDIDTIVYAIYPYVGCCAYDVTPVDVHQFKIAALQYKTNNKQNE